MLNGVMVNTKVLAFFCTHFNKEKAGENVFELSDKLKASIYFNFLKIKHQISLG